MAACGPAAGCAARLSRVRPVAGRELEPRLFTSNRSVHPASPIDRVIEETK